MKKTKHTTLAAIALLTALAASAQASNITVGDPVAGGINYGYSISMGGTDSAVISNHVGAWSWNNNTAGTPATPIQPPVGWTHTSTWVSLTVTEPVVLTLTMERKEGVPWPDPVNDPTRVASTTSMFPSFTIWTGLDNVTTTLDHTYNSIGNISWSSQLTYVDHYENTTLTSIERTWTLAPGQYTFALGSAAVANTSNRQGYEATFTTTAVPEPSTIALIAGGLGTLALIRRRKSA